MMEFGVFRKLKDRFGELLLHFDEERVKHRILERMEFHLRPKVKKNWLGKKTSVEEWGRREIENAFYAAWNDVTRMLMDETIRIP